MAKRRRFTPEFKAELVLKDISVAFLHLCVIIGSKLG